MFDQPLERVHQPRPVGTVDRGQGGIWMDSWVKWWTIRPLENSPGLLFSIPIFLGSAIAFRLFFNWHNN